LPIWAAGRRTSPSCGSGRRARGDRRADILATAGVQVGGDTFDTRIMVGRLARHFGAGTTYRSMEGKDLPFPSHLVGQLGRWHQVAFLRDRRTRDLLARLAATGSDPDAVERLRTLVEGNLAFFLFEEIERAKARLSSEEEATIRFAHGGIAIEEHVTRADFDALIAPDVRRIEACMRTVLDAAGVREPDVGSVFLTGGSATDSGAPAPLRARLRRGSAPVAGLPDDRCVRARARGAIVTDPPAKKTGTVSYLVPGRA
jgi:hypothetical chaperone protein